MRKVFLRCEKISTNNICLNFLSKKINLCINFVKAAIQRSVGFNQKKSKRKNPFSKNLYHMQKHIQNLVQQLPWSFFYNKKLTSFSCWKKPPEAFYKKGCSKNFSNPQERPLTHFIFNKIASLRPGTLLRKRLWLRCFPLIFVKF